MYLPRHLTILLCFSAAALCLAQTTPSPQPSPRFVILIDPSHGGSDEGARVADRTIEKDVNLSIALRLRSLLLARAFDIVLTRSQDASISIDDRAGTANVSHPIACIVIHAGSTGSGVHLYASAMPAGNAFAQTKIPWDTAQSPYVSSSLRLENEFAVALSRAGIPVSSGRTWLKPLENMQCPAVAMEVAPLHGLASNTSPAEGDYQQRVAATIAGALLAWRQQQSAGSVSGIQP